MMLPGIIMNDRYAAFMGIRPQRVPSWENLSCPDAESYITGIDYYQHPRQCRLKMREMYPFLDLGIPADDTPKAHPRGEMERQGDQHTVRWGDGETTEWDWGAMFHSADEVLKFSPVEQGDFTNIPVIESRDYRDEDKLYAEYRNRLPAEWGDSAPADDPSFVFFYNTLFMWPMLTFGWELFLETCMEDEFTRIMDEFAELSRRIFKAFAKQPVNFVVCHDDIVTARGPVCSPAWMNKHIFPRYEEFWSIVKDAGKEVIFMADGNMDQYADDIFACGARGIITEPYTDFKAIARKHENCMLAGEGDNRVLHRNDPDEIAAMVKQMQETAEMTNGYFMSVGNHIPWNTTPQGVKRYLDLCK